MKAQNIILKVIDRTLFVIVCIMSLSFLFSACSDGEDEDATERIYYIQDGEKVNFSIKKDQYCVNYNQDVQIYLENKNIEIVAQLSDDLVIISLPEIKGKTFESRRHKVLNKHNILTYVEPVLEYKDGTIQVTHGVIMLQVFGDIDLDNIFAGYNYTFELADLGGLKNYIVTIDSISTKEIFKIVTANNNNPDILTIEPSFIRIMDMDF